MASRSVNEVTLIGHLGRDAELKFTPSGVAVARFSIATSRRWKGQDDEWKEETDWHNVVLWRNENLAQYLTKGKQVYVKGRLQTRSWEKDDGEKRYATEVIAEEVILLGGSGNGREARDEDAPAPRQGRQQSQQQSKPRAQAQPDPFDSGGITDDDVPF